MTLRHFADLRGIEWQVWAVRPSIRETEAPEELDPTNAVKRVGVRPDFLTGWLSFEARGDRRRLTPIPADWESASEDQLRAWLELAQVVGRRPRLIE